MRCSLTLLPAADLRLRPGDSHTHAHWHRPRSELGRAACMARKHGYWYGGASGEQAVKSAAVVVPIRKAVDPGKWPAYRTSPALLQQPIPSLPTW